MLVSTTTEQDHALTMFIGLLTVMNYFIIGWFNGYLDHYYVDSFKIWFSIVLVFQALGSVSLAVLRVSERALVFQRKR